MKPFRKKWPSGCTGWRASACLALAVAASGAAGRVSAASSHPAAASPPAAGLALANREAPRVCEPLWPEGAPGALGKSTADIPFLTVYEPNPAKANGTAVLVLPGGAYGMLARRKEGVEPALWLGGLGIRAFQLDYRLGPAYRHPVQMGDARRAMRWVRAHATRYRLDPRRVGVLGFSAGGHLAATLATRFDAGDPESPDPVERAGDRPDFQILIYPVISMEAPFTHRASRANLLGRDPDASALDFLSAEKHVPPGAPPAFLVHAEADPVVSFANSRAYADALRRAGVPVEFLAFVRGTHAFGLAAEKTGEPGQAQLSTWPARCGKWLESLGMLGAAADTAAKAARPADIGSP